jgi:hypothetical protein
LTSTGAIWSNKGGATVLEAAVKKILVGFAVGFSLLFVIQIPFCFDSGVSLACVASSFFTALAIAAFGAGYAASEHISKNRLIDGAGKRKLALCVFPTCCLFIFLTLAASCIMGDVHQQKCVIGGMCDLDSECLTVPAIFAAVFAVIVGFKIFRTIGD